MNAVNSALFSCLSGLYLVLSLIFCVVFGAPKVKRVVSNRDHQHKRTAVITGSNTGIGFATANKLVLNHGIDVILACRSRDKAIKAAEKINATAHSAKVSARAIFLHPCDLSSLDSVQQFAKALHGNYKTIDLLILNAGVNNTTEGRTEDNLELIFQSNVLGHFLLTRLIFDLLPENGEGRIITLSSVAHHFVDSSASLDKNYWMKLSKLDTASSSLLPSYLRSVFEDCMQSYPPSKLATLLFAMELNRRFGSEDSKKRVRAFSVNPGAVASDIWRSFPSLTTLFIQKIFLSTEQGCATSVAAAVGDFNTDAVYLQPYWIPGPEGASQTAPFPVLEMMGPYVGFEVTKPRLPLDGGVFASKELWKACEEITGSWDC